MIGKPKSTRGGARPNAGRKKTDNLKKNICLKIYDSDRANLKAKYFSVQKALDKLCEDERRLPSISRK